MTQKTQDQTSAVELDESQLDQVQGGVRDGTSNTVTPTTSTGIKDGLSHISGQTSTGIKDGLSH